MKRLLSMIIIGCYIFLAGCATVPSAVVLTGNDLYVDNSTPTDCKVQVVYERRADSMWFTYMKRFTEQLLTSDAQAGEYTIFWWCSDGQQGSQTFNISERNIKRGPVLQILQSERVGA